MPKFMLRNLIDDHRSYEKHVRLSLIGTRTNSDGLPRTVSFHSPEYSGVLCINEVYTDDNGELHLSRCATYTMQRNELEEIKEKGILTVKTFNGRTITFQLLTENEEPVQEQKLDLVTTVLDLVL